MSKISKIAVPGVAEPYDIGTLSIPFGQVDSTSTDTTYTAQIEGITSLYDGVCVYLKNGVITSNKNGFTLNINGLGAKPVYDTLAAATRSGTVFNVDYTMLFVYNSSRVSGGCWDIFYGYNSDTTNLEEALRPLTGTTETLTPTQVYDAIKSGKSVVLQHTHSLLGLFTFASFNIFEREKTVVSTSIAKNGGIYLVGSLAGLAGSNEWVFNITEMAEADDIPVAVNEALAAAKESGEFDGADGKSAYAYAQDGGYTGTETEFAAKLAQEQLAGTTDELTPTQVYNAVSAGIPVKVQYTDSTYGLISFTAFTVSESQNVIASSMIAYYNGVYILCELVGDKSRNVWGFETTTLAQKEHSHSASDVKMTVTNGEMQMDVPLSNYLTDTILPMIQSRLLLKGGTMSGAINMGANSITNLAAPTDDADAATKKYVDNAISAAISSSGSGLSSNAKTLLIAILRNAIYNSDQSENITELEVELERTSDGGSGAVKYTVENNLTNVTSDNSKVLVDANASYTATLTADDGCVLDVVTVIMGGEDVTASVYADGVITIPAVTGDVIITATAIDPNADILATTTWIDGDRVNSSGVWTGQPNRCASDYIAVETGDIITIMLKDGVAGNKNVEYGNFSADKKHLNSGGGFFLNNSSDTYPPSAMFTVEDSTAYIRVSQGGTSSNIIIPATRQRGSV